MADRILSEEQIGQRMISMAIGRGLVTPEQVRECEEFAQENLFQGSVILALHYRGYLGSDELKKVIDLCLPDRKGDQPILEFAARTTNRPKKKSTRRTIVVARETIDKLAAEQRARRSTETGGHAKVDDKVIRYHEVIGPYHLVETLGRGGMARVVKAFHRDLGRFVALKFILSNKDQKMPELMRRFEQEAMLAAQLNHPHIVAIYDVDMQGEKPYIAMEYVDGPVLSELIGQRQLTVEDALRYSLQLARALHYAHDREILHRDIKPQNILIDAAGEPRLTDFGLAKSMSHPGVSGIKERVMGTPYYMSPEQIRGRAGEVGPASDVFSLGAVIFEMLSGELPFDADDELQVLKQILHYDPIVSLRHKNPAVDADLEAIVLKALEKNPQSRYRSAKELGDDLGNYIKGRPIRARPYSRSQRFWRWAFRRKRALGALMMLLLIAWGGWAYWGKVGQKPLQKTGRGQTSDKTRVEMSKGLMSQAAQKRMQGDRAWDRMLAAEKSGDLEAVRYWSSQVSVNYDGATSLYLRVLSVDASVQKAFAQRVGLLKKRLRHALITGDLAGQTRFAGDMRSVAQDPASRAGAAVSGLLKLDTVPAGLRFSIFPLQPDGGRLVQARQAVARGRTPTPDLRLAMGRYLMLITDNEGGSLRESLLVLPGQTHTVRLEVGDSGSLPEQLVYVPGGMIITGGDLGALGHRPRRVVRVAPFCISRFEVTVREYQEFINALPDRRERQTRAPRSALGNKLIWRQAADGEWVLPAGLNPERPVSGVSWEDAVAFTRWRSKRQGRTFRLPTGDEWECAARSSDGRFYPWGIRFSPGFCLSGDQGGAVIMLAVGKKPLDRSIYGVQDMAGSVREWVADWQSERLAQRMIRGGSYLTGSQAARAASIMGLHPRLVAPDVGFRIASNP